MPLPDDVTTARGRPAAFDAQAAGYDARTGFPPGAGEAVAEAIIHLASVEVDDLVLELGAGTGEIGVHLARMPLRYVGLDDSPAMLEIFRAKASPATPHLLLADGNADWPIQDASARAIFASRVIHLLQPLHVVREALRVAQPGGFLVLGRIEREPDSLKEHLQKRRQQLLREAGIQPRQGEAGTRRVIDLCLQEGCSSLDRQVAAEWTDETSPAAIIAGWETLTRMGSVEVEPVTRARILAQLREWAQEAYGDLDRLESYREQYVLHIVQLPDAVARRNV